MPNIKTESLNSFSPAIIIIKTDIPKKKHESNQVLLYIFRTWKSEKKSKVVAKIIIKIKRPMKLTHKAKTLAQIDNSYH